MLRPLKYATVAIGAALLLIAALLAYDYFFPATYEAVTNLPGTTSQIRVLLTPMHPWLAEYRRALVLGKAGVPDQRLEMFGDSGGYARTQLYQLPDGRFLVLGFFDAIIVDPERHSLIATPEKVQDRRTYLGAFDLTDSQWRFFSAAESFEQPLKAE